MFLHFSTNKSLYKFFIKQLQLLCLSGLQNLTMEALTTDLLNVDNK